MCISIVELQQILLEYCMQLTVSTLNMNYDKKDHVHICRRYFFVCQLKIVFYFLQELSKGVVTSLDSISGVAEGRSKNDSKKSSEIQATQNQEPF